MHRCHILLHFTAKQTFYQSVISTLTMALFHLGNTPGSGTYSRWAAVSINASAPPVFEVKLSAVRKAFG